MLTPRKIFIPCTRVVGCHSQGPWGRKEDKRDHLGQSSLHDHLRLSIEGARLGPGPAQLGHRIFFRVGDSLASSSHSRKSMKTKATCRILPPPLDLHPPAAALSHHRPSGREEIAPRKQVFVSVPSRARKASLHSFKRSVGASDMAVQHNTFVILGPASCDDVITLVSWSRAGLS